MKAIVLSVAFVACGGSAGDPVIPPPVVDSLSPQAGPWGTEVTIDGANFGVEPGTSAVAFAGAVGANGFVIDTWHDTEIRGRIAFPATGMMELRAPGGDVEVGAFATAEPWMPSSPFDVARLVAELVLSTGDVAGLYGEYELSNEAVLAVFGGSNAGTYPLDDLVDPQTASSPVIARLIEADDHTPEVIATKRDNTVVVFDVQGTSLVTTPTGLTGAVVAAARDQTGIYAWIDTASGLVRARPGAAWTIDRGPFASAFTPLDGAIAADGTLWIAVSEPASSTTAYVSVAMLAPVATQLGPLERADPTSYAGAISQAHLVLAADGIHALVLATAEAGGTSTTVTPRMRTAAVTWSDAPATPGAVQYAFVDTTLAAIVNDATAKSTSLVLDVTMPAGAQVIPVWPMQSEGLAIDGAGKAHPLTRFGDTAYALTPPP